jgi:hypothetical protein
MTSNSKPLDKLSFASTILLQSKNLNSMMNGTIKGSLEELHSKRDSIVNLIDRLLTDINQQYEIYDENTEIFNKLSQEKIDQFENKHQSQNGGYPNIPEMDEEMKTFDDLHKQSMTLIRDIENLKFYFNDVMSTVSGNIPSELIKESHGLDKEEYRQLKDYSSNLQNFSNLNTSITQVNPGKLSQSVWYKPQNNFSSMNQLHQTQKPKPEEIKIIKQVSSQDEESEQEDSEEENKIKCYDEIAKRTTIPKLLPKFVRGMRTAHQEGNYEDILYNPKYEEFYRTLTKGDYQYFTKVIKAHVTINNYTLKFKKKKDNFLENKIRLKYVRIMSYDHLNHDGCYKEKQILKHHQTNHNRVKLIMIPEFMEVFLKKEMPTFINNFNYYFYKVVGDKIIFYGECKLYQCLERRFVSGALRGGSIMYWEMKCFAHEVDMFKKFDETVMDDHDLTDEYIEELEIRNQELEDIRLCYAKCILNRINRMYQ